MAETEIRLGPVSGGNISLEGLLEERRGPECAIICHPHPLYGGSMHNSVVEALRDAFRACGIGTLRFNFRGVGGSGGVYGEGEGEADDILEASAFLELRGKTVLHLAGYSFGAWAALKALGRGLGAQSLTLASPPVDFLNFGDLRLPEAPCLITAGDRDAYCSVESLKRWIARSLPGPATLDLEIFPGCDHFYGGGESALAARAVAFLNANFAARFA